MGYLMIDKNVDKVSVFGPIGSQFSGEELLRQTLCHPGIAAAGETRQVGRGWLDRNRGKSKSMNWASVTLQNRLIMPSGKEWILCITASQLTCSQLTAGQQGNLVGDPAEPFAETQNLMVLFYCRPRKCRPVFTAGHK